MNFFNRYLNLCVALCFCVGIALFLGCSSTGDDYVSSLPVFNGSIRGTVVTPNPLASINGEIMPSTLVANAEVYLESNRTAYSTTTNQSGDFDLQVPFGSHRIVAVVQGATTKYKNRSNTITVSEQTPVHTISSFELSEAKNSVRGVIRNTNGVGLANAEMTLWGETFKTDQNGVFTTPLMPANVVESILVSIPGYESQTIPVQFGNPSPPHIDLTLVPAGATNKPPVVSAYADQYEVSPNAFVNFIATAQDPNGDTLLLQWTATRGTLSSGTGNLNAVWQAPTANTNATITFSASDGAFTSTVSIGIKTGAGGEPAAVNHPPTVDLIATGVTVLGGTVITLTASATDIDQDTLSYAWTVATGTLTTASSRVTNWATPQVTTNTFASVSVTVNDGNGGTGTDMRYFTLTASEVSTDPATPSAFIVIPRPGTLQPPGAISFNGVGNDPLEGSIGSQHLKWYLTDPAGTRSTLAEGSALFQHEITQPGTYTVTLDVTNSHGMTGTTSVNFRVNSAPTVTIISPSQGEVFWTKTPIAFSSNATDIEDGAITGEKLVWYSGENPFGTGPTLNYSGLSAGVHNISLRAKDSLNAESQAAISITLNATDTAPPIASITSPEAYSIIPPGIIPFQGSGRDEETGPIHADEYKWYLAESPASITMIAEGISLFTHRIIKPGTYSIRLEVENPEGRIGSVSIPFRINAPPIATITAPASGSVHLLGSQITFTGSASDTEDGAITGANLSWYDGATFLQTGNTFDHIGLGAGSHTIYLRATDRHNAIGSASIPLLINSAPLASITLPISGTVFHEGTAVTLVATATDPDGFEIPDDSMEWYHGATLLGNSSMTSHVFAPGNNTIVFRAYDQYNAMGSSTIDIFVNRPPVMSYSINGSESDNRIFFNTETLTFIGWGTDPESGEVASDTMYWYDCHNGATGTPILGTATGTFSKVFPTQFGTHVVTLRGADAYGAAASHTKTFHINATPTCTLSQPASGTRHDTDTAISFAGTSDDQDDNDILTSRWYCDAQLLGEGLEISAAIAEPGYHTITHSVTDSYGVQCATTSGILVNRPAQVEIYIEPLTLGEQYATTSLLLPVFLISPDASYGIRFTASGTDYEEGDLTAASMSWSLAQNSSTYDAIGTGNPRQWNFGNLGSEETGSFTIRLDYSDEYGTPSRAEKTFHVWEWRTFLSAGAGDNETNSPTGVTMTSGGKLYLGDAGNSRITEHGYSGINLVQTNEWGGVASIPFPILDVAVDGSANIYLLQADGLIIKFNSSFAPVASWTTTGSGQIAAASYLYIADNVNGTVERFELDGNDTASPLTGLASPTGLITSGNYIFVAHRSGAEGEICKYDGGYNLQTGWGSTGRVRDGYSTILALGASSDGVLAVADRGNDTVTVLLANGTDNARFGENGPGIGQFDAPSGITMDSSRNLYVSDTNNDRIVRIKIRSQSGHASSW